MNLGMNLGKAAGAGLVDHLHWHVVPRWHGDTNFMPMLCGARVISEGLAVSWQRLRPAFKAHAQTRARKPRAKKSGGKIRRARG